VKKANKGGRCAVILLEQTRVLKIVQTGLLPCSALAWAASFNNDLRIPGGGMRYAVVIPEPLPQPISDAIRRAVARSRSA
jgi:hypothetical protein